MESTSSPTTDGGAPWRKAALGDLRLVVGTRLQVVGAANGAEHLTTLVGYVDRQFVVARIPPETGLSAALKPGEPLNVRLFDGLQAVQFATTVVRVLFAPFSLLMLQYPETVDVQPLRRLPRIPVDLSAAVTLPDDTSERLSNGRIVDLSPEGARVHVAGLRADAGQRCRIAFELTMEADQPPIPVRLNATVRAAKALGTQAMTLGLAFDAPPVQYRAVLRAVVFERLLAS